MVLNREETWEIIYLDGDVEEAGITQLVTEHFLPIHILQHILFYDQFFLLNFQLSFKP